jgi:glutathione S-transferase
MIRFYGAPMSSACRSHWMLEEIGIPYEYIKVSPRDGSTRSSDFLSISPGGRIPAIDDDGFRLFESLAINRYLGEKYRPELLGRNLKERALVDQWSLWALTNLQPEPFNVMMHTVFLPESERSPKAVQASHAAAEPLLRLLDDTVQGKEFIVGDTFTVADINVASVAVHATVVGFLAEHPKTGAWVHSITQRPSFKRSMARDRHESLRPA